MTHYPLLFGFRDLVAGRGFLAGITVNGRALLVHDDDLGYWMYGVNPSGLSAGGPDVGEALRSFRETYRTVLFDIAEDANTFEEFKVEVHRFFDETGGFLSDWTDAVNEVKAGKVQQDWFPEADATRTKPKIEVTQLSADRLEPRLNEPDEQPVLAWAAGF